MKKEDCLENFKEMIQNSWTYARLTEDEKTRWENLLNRGPETQCLKGNYLQRWRILQAIYDSFLMALDYKPIGWRE